MPFGHGPPHHGPPHHGPPHHPPYPQHLYPPHHPPHHRPHHFPHLTIPLVVPVPTYNPPPPEPAPTYVTNYIYQPPTEPQPTPVHVVDHAPVQVAPPYQDYVDWVPSTPHTAFNLSHRVVVAGKEPGIGASPLWVIRAHHNGELVPGKLAVNDKRAYISYCGKEVPVHNFEVLCAPSHLIRWLPSSNGNVPSGAIVGGNTATGETLYIGRTRQLSLANFGTSLCPGKVHPSHGCLYIPFNHVEVAHKEYEVLCRIVG